MSDEQPSGEPSPVEVAGSGEDPATPAATVEATAPATPASPRRRRLKRALAGVGVTVGVLVALIALLYFFGGMERPSPQMRAAFDQMVSDGRAVPVESRFVIPIPGCRCHSDDPVLTAEHAAHRIRECSGCHAR